MNIFKRILIFTVMLTGSFVIIAGPNAAQAALFSGAKDDACRGANLSGNSNCDAGAADKIGDTVKAIINILSIIIGIIAVIAIIVNGLRFITSGGDSSSVNSARNGVIYAIVGLIVVALAQVIVRFVLSRI